MVGGPARRGVSATAALAMDAALARGYRTSRGTMTRVRERMSALHAVARSEGWAGIWERCRTRFFSRGRFGRWEIDLTAWTPAPPPPGPVEVRRVSLEELARLRRDAPGLPSEFYADAFHGARHCYVAFCEGTVAHISWLFTSEDLTRQVRLRPGEVELNFAYTVPAFRGHGLLTAVETAALRDAQRRGMKRAYTHVAVDNTASARGVRKTGFTLTGVVTLTWILGLCLRRFTPLPPARSPTEPAATT
jgi:RimJ/RimL family protein N-acetyltransferase